MTLPIKSTLVAAAFALAGTLAFAQAPIVREFPANSPPAQSDQSPAQSGQSQEPSPQDPQTLPGQPHRHQVGHQLHHLQQALGLTPEQTAAIRPILEDQHRQVAALQSDTSLSPQQVHHQLHTIRRDSDAKLQAVLTDAQRQQYATLKAEHHNRQSPQNGQPDSQQDGEPAAPPSPAL